MTETVTPEATQSTLQKIIRISPTFDRRNPDPSKNYGIGSVRMLFVLKGDKGAITFSCSTGMYLPQQVSEHGREPWNQWQPMGYGVWYCSPIPQEGQTPREDCEWLDGKPCYGDGSCMASDDVMDALLRDGEDGVWRELERFYKSWLDPHFTQAPL